MQFSSVAATFVVLIFACDAASSAGKKHHHHHHGHKHHHKDEHEKVKATQEQANNSSVHTPETAILKKMDGLIKKLSEQPVQPIANGTIEVNGPLPADIQERFVQFSSMAAGVNPVEVKVLGVQPLGSKGDLSEIIFQAKKDVVLGIEHQAADPESKLANSPLRSFLIARDGDGDEGDSETTSESVSPTSSAAMSEPAAETIGAASVEQQAETPVSEKGIDIDTAMPYGELEPFGREDTAQELTESSVKESDEMVDQLERAEVAEEKRAVFRALTRLRGAAITSFDGIARSQTGNIDEYNKVHQWRSTHPLHHLADEESDISKWAFPDNADF